MDGNRANRPVEPPRDVVFSVLSNRRRRQVLRYLRTCESTVEVRDLARQVAAWENDLSPDELTYQQRKRVYTSLHQTHLPKLDESGFVTYDRDRGTVTYEPLAETLEPYLTGEVASRRPWYRYYLGAGTVFLVAVLLSWLGVPGFAAVPGFAWAGLVVGGVVALATVHASLEVEWDRERNDH
jgi:DNA-binding transcriptional ArsR family regulator